MEPKKTPRADLRRLRGLFFEVGLAAALLGVIGAFAWGKGEKKLPVLTETKPPPVEQEMLPAVTRREVERPPEREAVRPPARRGEMLDRPVHTALSDFIDVVGNEDETENDETTAAVGDADPGTFEPPPPETVDEEPVEEDEAVAAADEMPSFMGGDLGRFRSWVYSRLEYPREAFDESLEGTATVSFVIEKDGSLTIIGDDGGADPVFAREVVRVLELSPAWTPGRNGGREVRVLFVMPVEFVLQRNR